MIADSKDKAGGFVCIKLRTSRLLGILTNRSAAKN